jgi:hypothetical protein
VNNKTVAYIQLRPIDDFHWSSGEHLCVMMYQVNTKINYGVISWRLNIRERATNRLLKEKSKGKCNKVTLSWFMPRMQMRGGEEV